MFFWNSWNHDSQRWMRSFVRRYVRSRVALMKTVGVVVKPCDNSDLFLLEVPDAEVGRAVRKLLLSRENRKADVVPETQEPLFEDLW